MRDTKIIGWQKSSFIDFPGTVSTVLFLSGCNLRCPYCHNPGIVLNQYDPILFDDIRAYITKYKHILEGVVISGGEPSLHRGLKSLCDDLKTFDLRIKIDTNGLNPEAIINCAPDYLALDIKTAIEKYSRLTSISSLPHDYRERLGMAIGVAKRMSQNAEVRITAVPGIVDIDDVDSLCIDLRGVSKLFIQQFNPSQDMLDPAYSSLKPYTLLELDGFRDRFLRAGVGCEVRA
jgi:pyruvate formate lyase activating enzyme